MHVECCDQSPSVQLITIVAHHRQGIYAQIVQNQIKFLFDVTEMENTRLLPIRVTPEQEVAIQAFFQINGWTLMLEEIQTHCDSCKRSLIETEEEIHQEEPNMSVLEPQNIPIVQVTVNDTENIPVTRRVMTITTQGAHKPYKCEHCGKGFRKQSHVKAHNKLHTGENLYQCETCGKYFMYRHNLISHASIHTGIRPFKCMQCGKTFRRKDDLQSHVRVHTVSSSHGSEEVGLAEALVSMRSAKVKKLPIENGDVEVLGQIEDGQTEIEEVEVEISGKDISEEVERKPILSEVNTNQIGTQAKVLQTRLSSRMIRTGPPMATPDKNPINIKVESDLVKSNQGMVTTSSHQTSANPRILVTRPKTQTVVLSGTNSNSAQMIQRTVAHPENMQTVVSTSQAILQSPVKQSYRVPVSQELHVNDANQVISVMAPQFQISEENSNIQTVEIRVPDQSQNASGRSEIQLVETSGHLANPADIALISDIVTQIIQQPESLQSTEVIIPHTSQLDHVHVLQEGEESIIINEGADNTIQILQNAHEALQ
ncbi:hypothetical protein ScPMuIL_016428 [Solemya velum]